MTKIRGLREAYEDIDSTNTEEIVYRLEGIFRSYSSLIDIFKEAHREGSKFMPIDIANEIFHHQWNLVFPANENPVKSPGDLFLRIEKLAKNMEPESLNHTYLESYITGHRGENPSSSEMILTIQAAKLNLSIENSIKYLNAKRWLNILLFVFFVTPASLLFMAIPFILLRLTEYLPTVFTSFSDDLSFFGGIIIIIIWLISFLIYVVIYLIGAVKCYEFIFNFFERKIYLKIKKIDEDSDDVQ